MNIQENLLNIYIITYNRDKFLSRTLDYFVSSVFSKCKITILDNCSVDNTFLVYEDYKSKFDNLVYIKHIINIGGCANYLRAIELSDSYYTWVICDDDVYDFSDCEDLIEELNKKVINYFLVGYNSSFVWTPYGNVFRPQDLIENYNYPYLHLTGFMPSCIFKTTLFQKKIDVAYFNIATLLPHTPYFLDALKQNDPIYISKKKLVIAENVTNSYKAIDLIIGTLKVLNNYDIPNYKAKLFFSVFKNKSRIRNIVYLSFLFKVENVGFENYAILFKFLKISEIFLVLILQPLIYIFTLNSYLKNKFILKKL